MPTPPPPQPPSGDDGRWQGLLDDLTARLAADPGGGLALVALAIDRFDAVRQVFGDAQAERLRGSVASRLGQILGSGAVLAERPPDLFVVLLGRVDSLEEAQAGAEELRALCRDTLIDGPDQISITVSGAVSLLDAAVSVGPQLQRLVDAAVRARAEGMDRCCLVASGEQRRLERQHRTLQELEQALAAGLVQAWFMPIVELGSSNLVGYEALVRWVREDGTVDLPDTFLPLAWGTQLATAIDLHIIRQALLALPQLPPAVSVSANVHASTLGDPGLVALIEEWLQEAPLQPGRLRLEITETSLLSPDATVRTCMDRLSAHGVRWLLDDFGVGFSSISHLRDLPIHGIKLDRSFAEAILRGDHKSVRLAQALAGLAEGLGLETIAEGIERDEQAQSFQELGWACGQGWHYGKAAALGEWQRAAGQLRPVPMPVPLVGSGNWALAVTENVPVGLFAIRQHLEQPPVLMFVSRRLLEILQLEKSAITPNPARVLDRFEPEDAAVLIRLWRERQLDQELFRWEGRLLGSALPRWVRVEAMPRRQADGVILWQGVVSDITERKQRELYLRRILDEAPIPIAIQELGGEDPQLTYLNRQFQQVFGYDLTAIPRLSRWAELAYPDVDYRRAVFANWNAAVARAVASQGAVESMELRVVAADGQVRTTLISAVVVGEELVISAVDVTTHRQAERDLARVRAIEAETALAITEAIPVGTYTMVQPAEGGMGSFAFMSERFLHICGLDREEASSDPLKAFACVHPDDYDDWVRLNAETFANKLPFYGECRVIADGQVRWISAESVPRDLPDGSTVWEGVLIDITRQKQIEQEFTSSNRRLQQLATTDSLTGCRNRRHLEDLIRLAVQSADRTGQPLSLLLSDLDFFKAINDGHGHHLGDQVLIRFVERVQALLPETVTLGRWGGEEFILLLPGHALDQAEELAERLRRLVEAEAFPHGKPVTASFGVAERLPLEAVTAWFRRLDHSLYRAKQSGRNSVCVDRPPR